MVYKSALKWYNKMLIYFNSQQLPNGKQEINELSQIIPPARP